LADWWRQEFNLLLEKDFKVEESIPAVFIDAFYNQHNPSEVRKFEDNVNDLITFAKSRWKYYLKNTFFLLHYKVVCQ
jgi:hypothetical protein